MLIPETDSIEFYKGLLRKWGDHDVRCLGWGSEQSQARRFDALLALVKPTHTVLDVGCGRGDLARCVEYYRYHGVDTCNSMVLAARKLYPYHRFSVGTIADFKRSEYDWVVASGVFALANEDWEYRTLEILRKMYDVCSKGVAANFMVLAGNENTTMHYTNEDEIDELVRRLCRKREYLHGYLPNDFTLILHRGRRARK